MINQLTAKDSPLLFRALGANGLFSLSSGLVMVIGAKPLSHWLGLASHYWILGLGLVLVGFGVSLLRHWRRSRVYRLEAIAISALDLGWVVGSAALLIMAPAWLQREGVWAVLSVALVVLIFFELQALALWRLRASREA